MVRIAACAPAHLPLSSRLITSRAAGSGPALSPRRQSSVLLRSAVSWSASSDADSDPHHAPRVGNLPALHASRPRALTGLPTWPEVVPPGLREPALFSNDFKVAMGLPGAQDETQLPAPAAPSSKAGAGRDGPPTRVSSCSADEPAPGPQDLGVAAGKGRTAAAGAAALAARGVVGSGGGTGGSATPRDTVHVRSGAS